MVAYKLVRKRKDGSIGSLFINKKVVIPFGVWLDAEDHPTKGYKHRPGWHLTLKPFAPHLTIKDRVWVKAEVDDYVIQGRPLSQGGRWVLANRMLVTEEYTNWKDDLILEIACCGSSNWLDMETVHEELNRIKFSYNSKITLFHRNNKGSDRIVNWQGRNLGFKVINTPNPVKENTDLLVVFQKNGSKDNKDLISFAKKKSIPIKVVRGY